MKNLFWIFIFALLSACISTPEKELLPNEKLSESEHLVIATNWFQKSAEMRACYYQAYQLAHWQLDIKVSEYNGIKPMAVVFDIDETLLDNSPYESHLINSGTLYSSKGWKEWTDKMEALALPGALAFVNHAESKGVSVFYISNRKTDEFATTLQNLINSGFPVKDSTRLLLRGMNESGDKTSRRSLVSEKYEVLLFVGDNLTDFSQIFADRGSDLGFAVVDSMKQHFGNDFIILPNPIYGEWEGALYGNDYKKSAVEKRKLRKDILKGY